MPSFGMMPGMSGLGGMNFGGMSGAQLQGMGVSSSTLMLMAQISMMMAQVLSGLSQFIQQLLAAQARRQQQGGTPFVGPGSFSNPGASPGSTTGGVNPGSGINGAPAGSRENAAIQWALSKEGISEQSNPGAVRSFSNGAWQAWCADFVSKAFESTGGSPWGHISSVAGIRAWGERNGRYFSKGARQPQPGDVIVFQGQGMSHVGIVTRVEGGRVYTIEGNTSDRVAQRSYSLSDGRITGFVRPFG